MIFCVSRSSAAKMASQLANLWHATNSASRLWPRAEGVIQVDNLELQSKGFPLE